ncbi:hypothetical protein ABVL66_12350 [Lacticaseibacillus paracasei]|uniref:hypothetical protein n=1 Tax=Lacticaseibacillus paracasei TaxID=1597 RepID=UPI00336BAA4F
MSKHIVANLAGKWIDLTEADDVVMGPRQASPYIWWEEGALLNSGKDKANVDPIYDSLYNDPFIMISYAGEDYRVNPDLIQVVTK